MHEKIFFIILNLLWAGSILGISLESWVKFKAKTLTRPVALDVGRTVFNAFHKTQIAFAIMLFFVAIFLHLSKLEWSMLFFIGMILSVQVIFLFPVLNNNANLIIHGKNPKKSSTHSVYGVLEILKISLLIFLSIVLLK